MATKNDAVALAAAWRARRRTATGKGRSRSSARGAPASGRRNLTALPRSQPAATPRLRLMSLLLALVLGFLAIIGRLAWVQGVSAGRFAAIGVSQRTHTVTLSADRGSIFDRNGNELAISVPQTTVWADPHLVADPAAAARALAAPLGIDAATLQDRLTRPEHFVYLARRIDDLAATAVRALQLKGVFFLSEPKRFSPAGGLAAPVLGTVGTDNQGLSGLEVGYEKALAGRPGKLTVEQDPAGHDLPGGAHQLHPSARGSDLVLTLDRSLQYETEQDLAAEIVKANAKGGTAAVMNTSTGEILAMANLVAGPNPGDPPRPAPTNEAVTNVFEPGSVNKLVTWSAALDAGIVKPGDVRSVPDTIRVAGVPFSDDNAHPTYNWTTTDILTASSNVGTIDIAQKLGKDRLDSYLRKYGFGTKSAINFPGESAGLLLDPHHWYPTSIATVPIGQGVAVTALQILAAYNTVANGGVYVAPKLVKAVVDPSGRTVPTAPSASHRVVSARTAREMTAMLSEVVRTGTATAAGIDGYDVSGKTGTARKTVEGQRGYKAGAYFSSFAGYVPSEHPAFTALVVLDEPTPIFFGGLVAAPVFAQVARYGLRELVVPPPPNDPHLFDGVPHAVPSAATVVGEPGGAPPAGAVAITPTPSPLTSVVASPVTTAAPKGVPSSVPQAPAKPASSPATTTSTTVPPPTTVKPPTGPPSTTETTSPPTTLAGSPATLPSRAPARSP